MTLQRYITEAIVRTCANCGEIDSLCGCGNFQNVAQKYGKKQ